MMKRGFQHLGEETIRQEVYILRKHTEHQPVNEMRYRVRIMATLSQRECEGSKLACHLLGQRVACECGLEVAGF